MAERPSTCLLFVFVFFSPSTFYFILSLSRSSLPLNHFPSNIIKYELCAFHSRIKFGLRFRSLPYILLRPKSLFMLCVWPIEWASSKHESESKDVRMFTKFFNALFNFFFCFLCTTKQEYIVHNIHINYEKEDDIHWIHTPVVVAQSIDEKEKQSIEDISGCILLYSMAYDIIWATQSLWCSQIRPVN